MIVRLANKSDVAAMLDIYRPFVENTAVSFETMAPTMDEFAARIEAYTQKYPWLVADAGGAIAGYAYAGKHRDRQAYQWSVEVSVYVHPAFYRLGTARLLYDRLLNLLTMQGFTNVYAVITLPNQPSIALHRAFGFEHIGVYKNAGLKLGKWHDVMWLAKYINPHMANRTAPVSVRNILHLP